jgi:predicted phosphodiesterase
MPGRYLIIADIHSNYEALTRVLEDARTLGWDECWCLGDVVGYGPQPVECLQCIRSELMPTAQVPGNHDSALFGNLTMTEGWALDAITSIQLNGEVLRQPEHQEVSDWAHEQFGIWPVEPRSVVVRGAIFVLTHGTIEYPLQGRVGWSRRMDKGIDEGCPEQVEKLLASSEFKWLSRFCDGLYASKQVDPAAPRRLLIGQTHVPTFLRATQANRFGFETLPISFNTGPQPIGDLPVIINSGSVGQPRDCDPRAAYAIYDSNDDSIEFRRVEYDYTRTQEALRKERYPQELIDRLAVGR